LPPKLRSKLQKGLEVMQGTKYHDLDNDCCESCGLEIQDGEFKDLRSRLFCPHVLCAVCSSGVAQPTKSKRSKKLKNSACPLCFPPEESLQVEHEKIRPNNYQPSSKVQALLKNLMSEGTNVKRFVTRPFSNFARIARAHTLRSVVFSGWTAMLDLVEVALEHRGSQFRRIDGSMSLAQRDKSLEDFRSKPECTVLLASIQSAGVGIDLTVASRVHLLEPLWNPLVEEQAMDRIHRMGQTQKVDTYRYIVKDSIDEHIIKLQEKKLRLVSVSFGDTQNNDTLKDLEDLLR